MSDKKSADQQTQDNQQASNKIKLLQGLLGHHNEKKQRFGEETLEYAAAQNSIDQVSSMIADLEGNIKDVDVDDDKDKDKDKDGVNTGNGVFTFKNRKECLQFIETMESAYDDLGIPTNTIEKPKHHFVTNKPECCQGKDIFNMNPEELEQLREEIETERLEALEKQKNGEAISPVWTEKNLHSQTKGVNLDKKSKEAAEDFGLPPASDVDAIVQPDIQGSSGASKENQR